MQIRWLQIFLVTLRGLLTDSEPNRSRLEGAQLIQPKSPLEPGIKMLTTVGFRVSENLNHGKWSRPARFAPLLCTSLQCVV